MLHNVPTQINKSARMVVLRHPNSQPCTVWRKQVNRTNEAERGGMPTLGGMGVLDSEDEADYEYVEVGEAMVLFTGQYAAADNNVNEADDGIIYSGPSSEALIECTADPDDADYFVPDSKDVLTVYPGAGLVVPYMIAGITSPGSIPPYSRKYALNPQADFERAI